LARRQHGVVTRAQLVELGMGTEAIRWRLADGRLHRLMRGIYAVGRPGVSIRGRWMAATLACGPRALLSHRAAAELWGICRSPGAEWEGGWAGGRDIDVVVPAGLSKERPGIRAHRRRDHEVPGRRALDGIPVTHPVATLVDLATRLPTGQLEAAINEADHLDLVDPERLLAALDPLPCWAGVGRLRALLTAPTTALTSTQLERLFLPIAREAGLPTPQTQVWLDGHRVDFYWPRLDLVVEADSLRYHRTAFKQARDKRRDNAHAGAGRTSLRFSHSQIRHEAEYVRRVLATTAQRLAAQRDGGERKHDR
jgi:very-short-patch-repair endonuclease